MEIKSSTGRVVKPTIALVVDYEFHMRKRLCKLINEQGLSLRDGLKEVMAHPDTRNRYFTTPLSISGPVESRLTGQDQGRGDRGRSRTPPWQRRDGPGGYDRGRGASKGPGKGRGGRGGRGGGGDRGGGMAGGPYPTSTPDGRRICFRFNNRNERCRGPCPFAHICLRCHGPHPAHMCPEGRRQSGAQGGAPAGGDGAGGDGAAAADGAAQAAPAAVLGGRGRRR